MVWTDPGSLSTASVARTHGGGNIPPPARGQRPVALSCLGVPSGPAGWKTLPSWYMVASNDNAIPPVAERAMATRAGAHTVEISSSHVAFISHPQETTDLILAAAAGS